MRTAIQLKLTQQLAMTQQLQQAIRLLWLSFLELAPCGVGASNLFSYLNIQLNALPKNTFFLSLLPPLLENLPFQRLQIRALIKKFILEGSSQLPLSDHKLTELLSKQAIHIARRTITKYMGINAYSCFKRMKRFEL